MNVWIKNNNVYGRGPVLFFCFHCEVYSQWLFFFTNPWRQNKAFRVFEKFIWFFDISAYRSKTFKGRTGTKSIMQKDVMVWLTMLCAQILANIISGTIQCSVEWRNCILLIKITYHGLSYNVSLRIMLQQNTFLLN